MERPAYKPADRSFKLLQAVLQEDAETFTATLPTLQPDEINKFHRFPHDVTCLMAALERGMVSFVQQLLDAGAEVNDTNAVRKMSPIHMAMKNGRPESLDLLLRFGANVNARDGDGQTALHILIRQWTKEAMSESTKWSNFDLLLTHPALNVNAEDNDEVTPLELAVKKGLASVARKLLQAGAVLNGHVREAMEEHMPELLADYADDGETINSISNNNPVEVTADYLETELWKALRNGHQEPFQQLLSTIRSGGVGLSVNLSTSTAPHNPTLLQYACDWQLSWAVAALLAAGVDANQTSGKMTSPPIVIAALKGNAEIVRLLVQDPNIQLDAVDHVQSGQTALHKIALRLHDASSALDKLRYGQCLQTLLTKSGPSSSVSINVNAQDAFGNTALHYAALSRVEEAVLQLLRGGAHLGIKNNLDETAVKRIPPSTLETFLDSCLKLSDGQESSNDFSITFDYSMLAPPRQPATRFQPPETAIHFANSHQDAAVVETVSLQTGSGERDKIYPECEALWHLSRSTKHQYLLKHPLLTSFLELKWNNIRLFYYINVLVTSPFFHFAMCAVWNRGRLDYSGSVYSLAVLVLSTYILLLNSGYDSEPSRDALDILWWCLLMFVLILFARELIQLGIAPLRYLFTVENYMELVMLAFTSVVLAHWDEPASYRHYSAVAVLLAWTEGLLLLGRHPKLSIFVTMFTTVSTTFLRLLLWYSVLLVGFALSFFLVFGPPEKEGSGFADVPGSLLKVSAMMSGELEFGELPFDANPFTSRIIFVTFLFLITIVLLNLLNGMAVSDTQAIQSKAETIGYVSRVELISYLESMLLGDPFHFLADWPPFSVIRRLCPSTSPLTVFMRGDSLRKLIGAESTVLFYACLPNKVFTVYPHRKLNQVAAGQTVACKCHAKFRLDEHILQNAFQRAQESKDRSQPDANTTHILAEIEKLNSAVLLLHSQNTKLMQMIQHSGPSLS